MMTPLQRVQTVLNGGMPDRLPVLPQSFMFAAADNGMPIGTINRDAAKMARCLMDCREKYGYDGCILDVDDASLAEACGAKVIYRDNDVAVVDEAHPLLEELSDIDNLKLPDPYSSARLPVWLETTERMLSEVGKDVFIMGRADQGPFDLLCLLRGPQEFMMDLIDEEPEVIAHAMEWATEAHVRFARAMLKLGAHATSMGDSYASPNLISAKFYRQFAKPYEQMVVDAVRDLPGAYSIHICGDTTLIFDDMKDLRPDIMELDWKADMGVARKVLPDSVTLMGNIDPSDPLVLGTPEKVRAQVKEMVEKTRGRKLIISSGCAMGANTKPENMRALVESAALYATAEQLEALQAGE
ncbi:MAG: uroporphyrinogen decarboxylase family protein [Clostridia bacterium]|nr:uroporphyrinogen decarboxylase family protein [Clostridia bacterium]